MRIFIKLLDTTLNEGIEYIDYRDNNGFKRKTKIYTNASAEKIAESAIQAINNKYVIGGVYTTGDKNIILFDRYVLEHEEVIGFLDLYRSHGRGAIISFYIRPLGKRWFLNASGWSTVMTKETATNLLSDNDQIKEAMKITNNMGYEHI